jgi:L-amino acid N-acyltransferase YncA
MTVRTATAADAAEIARIYNEGVEDRIASTATYRPRECYARVAEFSVYVARDARGRGVGRLALRELLAAAARAGLTKLVSRIFPENHASRAVCRAVGFREVGVYAKHGQLDGVWKDCVIVERLLGEAAGG